MCPHQKMTRKTGQMPWDLFTKVVGECRSFERGGLKVFLHKDGEPLLDSLLFRRIEYVKRNLPRSKVHIDTNAMLLDSEKAKMLLASRIDSVTFSVDGASEETYGQTRKGLDYAVVRNNVEGFFRLRTGSANRVKVTMQMVVSKDDKHETQKYRRLWSGKADMVYFKTMHNFLDMGTSTRTKALATRQLRFCKQPFDDMYIYWNGDVALCCWDYDDFVQAGSISKENLLAVFNNQKFHEIRSKMLRMDCSEFTPCNRCSQIYGLDSIFDSWRPSCTPSRT
jgi:hypothetical protein